MPKSIKCLAIVYCIALVTIFSIVPWNVSQKTGTRKASTIHSISYGFIFAPPSGAREIKYKQVTFELIGLTSVTGVVYWYLKKKVP